MAIGHLWYVRRGADKRGPFPAALIERNIALGRIRATDMISADGEHWALAITYPDYELHVRAGQDETLRRRLDERQGERRTSAVTQSMEHRTGSDRRADEDEIILQQRARARHIWNSLRPERRSARGAWAGIACILLAVGTVAWWSRPPAPTPVTNCAAEPGPGVVWDFCSMQARMLAHAALEGASLRNTKLAGADLSAAQLERANLAYADLAAAHLSGVAASGANFKGSNLRGAALTAAVLRDTSFEFADFTQADVAQADFTGANLDHAIWVDGRVCRPPSVGRCR